MDYIKIIKLLIPITVYEVFVVIFLNKLNKLNNYLIEVYSDSSPLELLQYNDWEPLDYFGITLVLGIIAGIVFVYCLNILKNSYTDLEEITACILSMIFCVITVIVLVKFISVPILKAVFGATVTLLSMVYKMSKR